MRSMGTVRALLEYVPIRIASILLRLVPRRAALGLGRLAGRVACALDGRHRRVAMENLRIAFGDSLAEKERRALVRRVFAHFGMTAVDCLMMGRLGPGDMDRLIEYEGVEHLRKAFLKGKGVLAFSGHLGNWEMIALMQGWVGYPLAVVSRPLDNPLLEDLLRSLRTASGNEVIHKRNAIRGILRALRNGWCVALIIDQDSRGTEHVFVDFFGRPTATITTLGLLALRTGAPILPAFGIPAPGGRYKITYLPEVEVEITGDREADVKAITQACTRIIEDWVRRHPECWLWMHRRWKRIPPGAERPASDAVMIERERA